MSSRQKQKREWQRQFILERAVAEFAQRGYQGTTMDRIAEAAEVSKGTLYNYFSNKRELFLTIIKWGSGRAGEIVEVALKDESRPVEERVRIFVDHFMKFFETGRDIHRILTVEGNRLALGSKGKLAHALRPSYAKILDLLEEFIRNGQQAGAFRQCDPRRAANVVFSIVSSEFHYSILSDYPGPISAHSREVTDFVLHALGASEISGDPAL